MSAPMKAGLAPDLDLDGDYIVQFTALSPTDGSVVTGVSVSNVSLLVENVAGGNLGDQPAFGDPLWISLPAEDVNS
jgi:hypothetical protein